MNLTNKSFKIQIFVILISIAFYVASLYANALTFNHNDEIKTHSSLSLLIMGAIAILGGGVFEWFIWLANPLYYLAILLFILSLRASIIVSFFATILALSFITWKEILAAENGSTASIVSLDAGYSLWLISLAILTIGILYYNKVKMVERNGKYIV